MLCSNSLLFCFTYPAYESFNQISAAVPAQSCFPCFQSPTIKVNPDITNVHKNPMIFSSGVTPADGQGGTDVYPNMSSGGQPPIGFEAEGKVVTRTCLPTDSLGVCMVVGFIPGTLGMFLCVQTNGFGLTMALGYPFLIFFLPPFYFYPPFFYRIKIFGGFLLTL